MFDVRFGQNIELELTDDVLICGSDGDCKVDDGIDNCLYNHRCVT